ncbi:hypothetical protein VTI74DRAFT_3806 [Chaetomium olivicolor]
MHRFLVGYWVRTYEVERTVTLNGGRDATDAFRKAHSEWEKVLKKHSFLRSRRLVEERSLDADMDGDEIALRNKAYRITALAKADETKLVCAKFATKLLNATPAELQKRAFVHNEEERKRKPRADDPNWRGWVTAEKKVYDVTTTVMYVGVELEQTIRSWLGKEVQEAEIARSLWDDHEAFIVGEFIDGVTGEHIGLSC